MKILVTGSSGHLGEGLVRTLKKQHHDVVSIDINPSVFTSHLGSITDKNLIRELMEGVDAVLHSATLHKPHVATHSLQQFVETNITGTLNLLEEAVAAGVKSFIFTSTTSTFGDALTPPENAPAAWITETVRPIPKNIYGVTKTAAEDLCQLFYRNHQLPCLILRTSRFFPEEDDKKAIRETYSDENAKANELLYRRVDVEDVVNAHLLAIEKAPKLGFGRYIISATTPFTEGDLGQLNKDASVVVKAKFPEFEELFAVRNWKMFPAIGRVYVNELARKELIWQPKYDFRHVLNCLQNNQDLQSSLAKEIGAKGYHQEKFTEGPYPVHD